MSLTLLVGAGASAQAGVPDSRALTARLVSRIQQDRSSHDPSLSKLLNYVCGRLIAHETAAGSSPFATVDVERLLAAIRLLSQRDNLEVSPFVAAWDDPVADLTRKTRSVSVGETIMTEFGNQTDTSRAPSRLAAARAIDVAIDAQLEARVGGGDSRAYTALMEELMVVLPSLLQPSLPVDYLSPIATLRKNGWLSSILTLNYDTCVEQVLFENDVAFDTGFKSWLETGTLKYTDGLPVIKLHGSIDWIVPSEGPGPPGQMPLVTPRPWNAGRSLLPLLVFGAREKLRPDGPFLELLHEARSALADSERLVVVGYSFRDDHINELIRHWLSGDIRRTIRVIDPVLGARNDVWGEHPFISQLRQHLIDAWPPHRERRFADRLRFEPVDAKVGLAMLP